MKHFVLLGSFAFITQSAGAAETSLADLQAAVTASHLRLTAVSGFGKDRVAALADFAIHYTGPPLPGTQLPPPTYQPARSASTDVEEGN